MRCNFIFFVWLFFTCIFSQQVRAQLGENITINEKKAEQALRNAYSLRLTDTIRFKRALEKVSYSFKNSDFASKALGILATSSNNKVEKINYYEQIKKVYLPQKFRSASDSMIEYVEFLLHEDRKRALNVIKDLTTNKVKYEKWDDLLLQVSKISSAEDLIASGKGGEALEILNNVKFPRFIEEPKPLIGLLKADAIFLISGSQATYDSLLYFYKTKPSVSIFNSLLKYGNAINKGPQAVRDDLVKILKKDAELATNFRLRNYFDNNYLSLSDLRGKAVLLTYWFPTCSPCRNEFTYFERVIKIFGDKKIAYVSINIEEEQANQVLQSIKNYEYSFIPLQETRYRNKGNLDNMGSAPVNFLINKNGILIFSGFRIDQSNEADLELMINLLVNESN